MQTEISSDTLVPVNDPTGEMSQHKQLYGTAWRDCLVVHGHNITCPVGRGYPVVFKVQY
jgi:hypothetical protein